MRTLITIAAVLTLAACAGPTATMSDKEVCMGIITAKSSSEMEAYGNVAEKRNADCEKLVDMTKLTEADLARMGKNLNTLVQQKQHLLK